VDAVMMPVNPVETILGGFLTHTLPAAKMKGLGIIGMKILGGGHYVVPQVGATADLLIRHAIDQGISVAIAGCSTPEEVEALVSAGKAQTPLTEADREELLAAFRPQARRLAFYRGVI
jgi:hypothetical protein